MSMKTNSLQNVFLSVLSKRTQKDVLIRQTILVPTHGWLVLFDSSNQPCVAFFAMRGGANPELDWIKATQNTKPDKKSQQYFVQYGDELNKAGKGYCVVDEVSRVVFADDSKSTVIAQAQRLNGFEPVDGDESTYSIQMRELV